MNTKLYVLLAAGVLALSACKKESTDAAADAAAATEQAADAAATAAETTGDAAATAADAAGDAAAAAGDAAAATVDARLRWLPLPASDDAPRWAQPSVASLKPTASVRPPIIG